jgi:LysR family glycine cleavage system transcriptional activator
MANLNWKLLTAFEAVARHRNFSRAAGELNVQQPAISRRVAELEAELGVKLVDRTRPNATMTREGEVLFRAVAGGILQVRSAVEQVRRRPDRRIVTVDTTIGFASCYLMKRLPAFRAANPDISVELVSRDLNDTYRSDAADIVIVFDHPDRLPGVQRAEIFSESLVAVARPDLAEAVGGNLDALHRQDLLFLTMGIHADDWQTYFAGTGIVPRSPASDHRFTSFMVYLQAALNGDGIILGWDTLLQDHFDIGQLAPVTTRRVRTERGYFACLTQRAQANHSAIRLFNWLSILERKKHDQDADGRI